MVNIKFDLVNLGGNYDTRTSDQLKEEFLKIFPKWKETKSPQLQEVLVGCVKRFVISRVDHYYKKHFKVPNRSFDKDDFIQESLMRVVGSFDKYDPNKGTPATYFGWQVLHACSRYHENTLRSIRVPCYKQWEGDYGYDSLSYDRALPNSDRLVDPETSYIDAASLQNFLFNGGDLFFSQVEQEVDTKRAIDTIHKLLVRNKGERLGNKMFGILIKYYCHGFSLRQIGIAYGGVSAEAIRQHREVALKVVRANFYSECAKRAA